jgi:diguanylate cyclase (GGDEF)-like protein
VAALTGVVGAGLGAIAGARFASRRERSAPEIRRRALVAITRAALDTRELDALYGAVAEHVRVALHADGCVIAEREGERLVPHGWSGAPRPVPTPLEPGSLAAAALAGPSPLLIDDVAEYRRHRPRPGLVEAGVRSIAAAPLRDAGGPFGTLGVTAGRPRAFTAQAGQWLLAVANVLVSARERSAAEQRVRHQALHDPLTGLPNRALLGDHLEQALARRERRPSPLAVLLADVDGFKGVNDRHGHHVGDQVLQEVARRLRARVRAVDTVARLGGDEFVVLCEDADTGAAERVVNAIRAAGDEPITCGPHELRVGIAVGLAWRDAGEAADADSLLREADAAMYRVKQSRRRGAA